MYSGVIVHIIQWIVKGAVNIEEYIRNQYMNGNTG